MAKKVIKAAYLALGGTDYSAYLESAELTLDADAADVTTMGSGGVKEFLQGLRSGKLSASFKLDADLSGLDAALYSAYNHATTNTLTFELRADSASVGSTNPKWTGTLLVNSYAPVVKLGEVSMRSIDFQTTGAVTRATS